MASHDPEERGAAEAGRSAQPLAGRSIIVGLSGGIACYKTAGLVSALVQDGAGVTAVMTEGATHFLTPLTLQALTGRPVYTSPWTHIEAHDPQHIALARRADLFIIAPCTMNMLAKLAHGRAGDIVTLIAAAMDLRRQPILLAPSMNEVMYQQRSTQRNLAQLRDDGFDIVGPGRGWQACRTEGEGRMAEPDELIERIRNRLCERTRSSADR